jgi:hypothetical protein
MFSREKLTATAVRMARDKRNADRMEEDNAVVHQCGWCGEVEVHLCPKLKRLKEEGKVK